LTVFKLGSLVDAGLSLGNWLKAILGAGNWSNTGLTAGALAKPELILGNKVKVGLARGNLLKEGLIIFGNGLNAGLMAFRLGILVFMLGSFTKPELILGGRAKVWLVGLATFMLGNLVKLEMNLGVCINVGLMVFKPGNLLNAGLCTGDNCSCLAGLTGNIGMREGLINSIGVIFMLGKVGFT
jgi:hypothetical protein